MVALVLKIAMVDSADVPGRAGQLPYPRLAGLPRPAWSGKPGGQRMEPAAEFVQCCDRLSFAWEDREAILGDPVLGGSV
jgi:hypothetical protein